MAERLLILVAVTVAIAVAIVVVQRWNKRRVNLVSQTAGGARPAELGEAPDGPPRRGLLLDPVLRRSVTPPRRRPSR